MKAPDTKPPAAATRAPLRRHKPGTITLPENPDMPARTRDQLLADPPAGSKAGIEMFTREERAELERLYGPLGDVARSRVRAWGKR